MSDEFESDVEIDDNEDRWGDYQERQFRQAAIDAALRLGLTNAHELIREAKKIEAYLKGEGDK